MAASMVAGQATGTANMGGGTTLAVAYPAANAAGNRLLAAASWGGSGSATITDSRGNTWRTIDTFHDTSNNQQFAVFECLNSSAGANTVTLNTSGVSFRWLVIDEATGLDTTTNAQASAAKQASATTATDNATSNSITPAQNGSLLWAAVMEDGDGSVIPSAGTGWTLRRNETTSLTTESQVQATVAAVSATWTMSKAAPSYLAYLLAFKPSGGGGTDVSGTAKVGASSWGGVKAASAASVLAMATVGGLAWSGVSASSTTTTPRTDTPRVGALAWSGVRAQSAADSVHTARVGSLTLGGVAPVLSIEDVVGGTGPGMVAWSGVRAASTATTITTTRVGALTWTGVRASSVALAGGNIDTARVAGLAFGGVNASSTSSTVTTGTAGGVAWSGIPATSAADLTSPTRLGFLGWSGVPASSTTAVIQTEAARVGSWSWAGVPAASTVDSVSTANAGAQSWSGVQASSRATGPNLRDLDLVATLHGDRYTGATHPDRYRSST